MKTVNENPVQFFKDGGWKFLETESDNESEQSETASEFTMSEEEDDYSESGEDDDSEFDEDASADEGSEMDEDSAEDWSEMEEEGTLNPVPRLMVAARADKRKANEPDNRQVKRRK